LRLLPTLQRRGGPNRPSSASVEARREPAPRFQRGDDLRLRKGRAQVGGVRRDDRVSASVENRDVPFVERKRVAVMVERVEVVFFERRLEELNRQIESVVEFFAVIGQKRFFKMRLLTLQNGASGDERSGEDERKGE
jgi:hypothetical protein